MYCIFKIKRKTISYHLKIIILYNFVFSFQPGHIRRRLKIQEIVGKYQIKMTKPELYTYLLSHANST